MHSSRLLDLLVVGRSAFAMVEANFVNIEMVARNIKAMVPRQLDAVTGSVTAQTSAPTSPGTTTTSSTTSTTSTTSTSSSKTTTSSSKSSSSSSSTGNTTPTPTTPPSTTDSSTTGSLETITRIITTTNSLGLETTITSATTSTNVAGLANNGNSGSAPGMSPQTRNTVIGVVVGIGGAIILAGLAIVAWRIWGRKKGPDENDGLMDYNGSVAGEKPDTVGSASGRTPFQSTLESYHAPTAVNASSNF